MLCPGHALCDISLKEIRWENKMEKTKNLIRFEAVQLEI